MQIKNIIFDLDSTLVTIEGLDFLAKLKNKQEELVPLTAKAMNGQLSMREAMNIKLNTIRPSLSDMKLMGQAYLENIVPGAKDSIKKLQALGYRVWILTGNFQPAVGMVANYLCIPSKRVITNKIFFDKYGEFLRIDLEHPLSNNHGKAKIIKNYGRSLSNVMMVGDGATDLDTKPVVKKFVCFTGVKLRPLVARQADVILEKLEINEILRIIKGN